MPDALPSLFDDMNDVDRTTGLRQCDERAVEVGDVVLRAGEPARGLLCVLDGTLEVRAGSSVVGRVGPGDLVGEMALFEATARTASVVAVSKGRILVLPRQGYERLRDVMHPLAVAVEQRAIRLQSERLRSVSDRIATLAEERPMPFSRPSERFFASLKGLFGLGGVSVAAQIDAIGALARSSIFVDAPREALGAVARHFRPAAYDAGHLLCVEGETGQAMYILAKGEVDVVVPTAENQVKELARLGVGAVFGMLSLAQDRPRMATCVARTAVVTLVLEQGGWNDLVHEPGLAGSTFRRALLRSLNDQLAYANQRLARYEAMARDDSDLLLAGAGVDTHPGSLPASHP